MYAVDNASSVVSQPTPVTAGSPGWFTDGDPGTGAPPTLFPADWANIVQAEMLAFLSAAGLTPSKTDNTQLLNAVASGALGYVAATGSANTYVGSLLAGSGGIPNANLTLRDGLYVRVKIPATNTGATTFNLNGLGARAVTLRGSALAGGELAAGDFFDFQYDTVTSSWRVTSSVVERATVFTATATGTGTANAQVVAATNPAGYTLQYGNIVNFTAGATNTLAATLNVNSTGAITVKKNSGGGLVDLAAGDLTSGNSYSVNYNGTFYVLIAATAVLTGYLVAANNLSDVASATTTRSNIGAAKSGANTDITSLTGVSIDATSTIAGKRASSSQASNYTFVIGDAGTLVMSSGASAQNFTIPPNSSVAFPLNTEIEIFQYGAGALSFVAGAGVTLRSRGSLLTLYSQYAAAALKKIGTDEWIIIGDLR